jgi:hypothetical protein
MIGIMVEEIGVHYFIKKKINHYFYRCVTLTKFKFL